jgi:hypothetical protein
MSAYRSPINGRSAWRERAFGLETEYDSDWLGRFQAIKSKLETINVNPVLSWEPTPRLTVGGVSWQHLKAELSNHVNYAGPLPASAPAWRRADTRHCCTATDRLGRRTGIGRGQRQRQRMGLEHRACGGDTTRPGTLRLPDRRSTTSAARSDDRKSGGARSAATDARPG